MADAKIRDVAGQLLNPVDVIQRALDLFVQQQPVLRRN